MSFQAKLAPTEKEIRDFVQEQVRIIIFERMQHIVKSDPQTRYLVADFIQTELGVRPEKVDFSVALSESGAKTITVLGYWKDGKYVKLEQPAKIAITQ